MTKRVLAFLMVIAMVFSLIPTVVVADGDTEAAAGYTMYLQKAHNQTSDLTVDVYLQANAAEQGDVTAFQFDITLAEGLTFDSAVDPAGATLAGSGAPEGVDARVLYEPADDSAIAVGDTNKTLVTTIGVELGETELADWTTAITLSDIKVSTANGYYTDVAPVDNPDTGYVAADDTDYKGAVTVADPIPFTACAAHGTTGWTAFAEPEDAVLKAGSYYLTDDVTLTAELDVDADAAVTICLNGYDITAADAKRIFNLNKSGATLNICDCTAHSAEDGTYVAGALKLAGGTYTYGGAVRIEEAAVETTVNLYDIILDGTNAPTNNGKMRPGAAIAVMGKNTLNMYGGLVQAFTCDESAGYGAIVLRGTGDENIATVNISGTTFDGCGNAIVGAGSGGNGKPDSSVVTLEDVTVKNTVTGDHLGYALMVGGNGYFKSATVKGDCRFDAPVFVADGQTVTLDLGENADVNIVTVSERTQEQFNEQVKMAEGGSLTEGTLLYETAGLYVTYDETAGLFAFVEGHEHMGKFFKAWDKSDSLPASGNYYLDTDVTVSSYLDVESELNLDLHGHTVRTTGGKIYDIWLGTLNLYDCSSTYDDEGNWLSAGTGKLTGFTTNNMGAIMLRTGATFNMYGGAISGNSGNNGVAVYMYATNSDTDKRDQNGAVFNMYGGEISGNTSTVYGAAISTNDFGEVRENRERAKINIYGGKISGNTTASSNADAQGTIRISGDTDVNMYGGEISGNTADYGGAFVLGTGGTLTVTGGKISGNTANKEGGAIYQANEAVVSISNAEVSGNSAPNGGAFRKMGTGGTLTVTDTKVTGNTATQSGGAAFVNGSPTITVTGGEWSGNTATKNGGAMRAEGSGEITFTNVNITGNTGTSGGGAFSIAGSHTASFTGCTLTGNVSSGAGSAIYISSSTTLRLDDTVVTGNDQQRTSTWHVGAVYSTNAANTVTLAGRTVIAGNLYNGSEPNVKLNLFFQSKTDRTDILLVDGLEAGAHIEAYNDDGTTREASVVVKNVAEEEVTNWSCGYITYYTKNDQSGKNVSYVDLTTGDADDGEDNPTFVFGHYHTGSTVALTPWTETTSLPTESGYYLTADVTISSAYSIANDTTYELCTNGKDIIGTNSDRCFRNTGGDLTVTDCTASYDADDHLIVGSQIRNFKATNGAAYAANTSGKVGGSATFRGIEFTGCTDTQTSTGWGGIVFVRYDSSLTVDGCKFTDCHTTSSGGAIWILRGGSSYSWITKSITNTVFENNYANKIGGAIYVEGNWQGEVLTVDNCVFNGNYAKAYAQTDNADTTDVDESTLATAGTGLGGAIYAKNVNVAITDSIFDGNYTSANGLSLTSIDACTAGAIYAGSGSYVTVDGSVFKDNSSAKAAGAIVNTSSRGFVVTNTEFSGNNAATAGGAIYVSTGTVSATGCGFEKNEATGDGGAIYVSATCTLNNCEFTSNEANRGGAVYTNGSSSRLNATSSSFTSNSATTTADRFGGGAMYLMHGKITLNACDFDANEAKFGGALVFNGQNADAALNTLTIGKVGDKGCAFTNNVADAQGGAIYIFTYNGTGSTASITGANFESNTASSGGGAIYLNSGGNTAELTGGPIVTIADTAITKNKGADGSAISANGYSATTLNNCTITGNTSTASYGALFVQTATTSMTLSGLMDVTGNTDNGTYGNSNLNMWNKADSQGKVTFKDLDPKSTIGVTASNARYDADPVVGNVTFTEGATTTIADVAPCFISDNENRYITHVKDDGTLMLTNYVDESGNTYQTLQDAYDAVVATGATKFVLQAGDSINKGLTLSSIDVIDLNGKNVSEITVPDGSTLKLMDSETNDFDIADGVYGQVTVTGTVEPYYKDGSNHYVVITKDGVSSAHRVYVSIRSRLLRPITNGAGFKASYAGDQMITDVAAFGINLTGQTGDGRQWAVVPFSGMEAGLPEDENDYPNEKLVAVTNLAPDHWEDTLYGQAYVTVGNVTVESVERSLVMKTMAASALNALEPTNLVYMQIQEMLDNLDLTVE